MMGNRSAESGELQLAEERYEEGDVLQVLPASLVGMVGDIEIAFFELGDRCLRGAAPECMREGANENWNQLIALGYRSARGVEKPRRCILRLTHDRGICRAA